MSFTSPLLFSRPRLMYESNGDFIGNTPPPPPQCCHHFYNPTLTYPAPCRLYNPSSSRTGPPLLCLNASVGFYRAQSKQSRAGESERERERECISGGGGTCTLSARRPPPRYTFSRDAEASKKRGNLKGEKRRLKKGRDPKRERAGASEPARERGRVERKDLPAQCAKRPVTPR